MYLFCGALSVKKIKSVALYTMTHFISIFKRNKKNKQKTQPKNKNPPIVKFFRGINKKNPSLLRNIATAFEG